MNDSILLRVAIGCSILGIIILAFISTFSDIPDYSVKEFIEDDNIKSNDYVEISGIVDNVKNYEAVTIITLRDNIYLETIAFENISIKEDEYITISGKVQDSNGKRQIIIEKIYK